jgi:multidrug efflux pump subunit AcrB
VRSPVEEHESHGRLYRTSERAFNWVVKSYGRTLATVLRFPAITLTVLLATMALNVYLYIHVPKGFFPATG